MLLAVKVETLRRLPSYASSERENSELSKSVKIFFMLICFFDIKRFPFLECQSICHRAKNAWKEMLKQPAASFAIVQDYAEMAVQ
jgi:hypothetical protein